MVLIDNTVKKLWAKNWKSQKPKHFGIHLPKVLINNIIFLNKFYESLLLKQQIHIKSYFLSDQPFSCYLNVNKLNQNHFGFYFHSFKNSKFSYTIKLI